MRAGRWSGRPGCRRPGWAGGPASDCAGSARPGRPGSDSARSPGRRHPVAVRRGRLGPAAARLAPARLPRPDLFRDHPDPPRRQGPRGAAAPATAGDRCLSTPPPSALGRRFHARAFPRTNIVHASRGFDVRTAICGARPARTGHHKSTPGACRTNGPQPGSKTGPTHAAGVHPSSDRWRDPRLSWSRSGWPPRSERGSLPPARLTSPWRWDCRSHR